MGKRKDVRYWNIPVPKPLNDAVEKAVSQDMHASKSEFVRDAVRVKLRQMGLAMNFAEKEEKTSNSSGEEDVTED